MKIKFYPAAIIICAFVLLSSCKKEKDIPATEVGSVDVANSKLMMVTGTLSGNNNQYYKITPTDKVEKVKVYDQFGAEIPDYISAISVYNVNNNYYMMYFTQNGRPTFLMFNKTTNAMTDLYSMGLGLPYLDNGIGDMNSHFSRNDSSQNIYFISQKSSTKSIVKLNTANQLTTTDVVKGNSIFDFTVDGYGNVLYYSDSIAVRKVGGGYLKCPSDFLFEQHWIDAHGKINYANGNVFQGNYDHATNTFGFSQKGTTPFLTSIRKSSTYFVNYKDKVIAFSNYQGEILELDNASNTTTKITSIPMNYFIAGGFSKSLSLAFIAGTYNSGSKNIFKINLANYSYTPLFSNNELTEIYDIEAFEDGTVYVGGKRASDDKYVLLKIDYSGAITTLDDTFTQPCYQLEKLSEFIYQNH